MVTMCVVFLPARAAKHDASQCQESSTSSPPTSTNSDRCTEAMMAESRQLPHEHASLAFTEANADRPRFIVFIHGAGAGGRDWHLNTPFMSTHHLLFPDLPAYGESAHIQPFSKHLSAELLAKLIREHAHQGRAHIVALSLGAFVAVELATAHPEVVDAMFISGLTCLPYDISTGLAFYLAWCVSKIESAAPGSLVSWLLDGITLPDSDPNLNTVSRQRAVLSTIARPQSIEPWKARTCIIAAGKSGILPTADSPADALRFRDAGRKVNAETIAFTHKGMRHAWNLQDPALFSRAAMAWFEGEPLPEGFVEL